jgi:hypothetical protein
VKEERWYEGWKEGKWEYRKNGKEKMQGRKLKGIWTE